MLALNGSKTHLGDSKLRLCPHLPQPFPALDASTDQRMRKDKTRTGRVKRSRMSYLLLPSHKEVVPVQSLGPE